MSRGGKFRSNLYIMKKDAIFQHDAAAAKVRQTEVCP